MQRVSYLLVFISFIVVSYTTVSERRTIAKDTELRVNVLNEKYALTQGGRGLKANKKKGKLFLAENKKRPEITETRSGLQYEILRTTNGPKPEAGARVTVHYHGTTLDGNVFDSSVERGKPSTFRLDRVISGWTEGVQLMGIGSKYKFYIPSKLAYGNETAGGGKIAPGSTLIFEIELLNIQ